MALLFAAPSTARGKEQMNAEGSYRLQDSRVSDYYHNCLVPAFLSREMTSLPQDHIIIIIVTVIIITTTINIKLLSAYYIQAPNQGL